ncbi:MAG: hypothetical protein LC644_05760, partial [Pseudonocardia sp.]|nr:hypothetical protein [Pseudonocardia sp.]
KRRRDPVNTNSPQPQTQGEAITFLRGLQGLPGQNPRPYGNSCPRDGMGNQPQTPPSGRRLTMT